MDAGLRDLPQIARGVNKRAETEEYGRGEDEEGGRPEKRGIFGGERSRGSERRGGEEASEVPEKAEEFRRPTLVGGSGPIKVAGGSGTISFSGTSDDADDRVPAKRTIGGGDRSEDDRSEEDEIEGLFNKDSIVGVAETPVLARPIGDQGTRKGSLADRPEPMAEH
jgi:hypothetical protein